MAAERLTAQTSTRNRRLELGGVRGVGQRGAVRSIDRSGSALLVSVHAYDRTRTVRGAMHPRRDTGTDHVAIVCFERAAIEVTQRSVKAKRKRVPIEDWHPQLFRPHGRQSHQ